MSKFNWTRAKVRKIDGRPDRQIVFLKDGNLTSSANFLFDYNSGTLSGGSNIFDYISGTLTSSGSLTTSSLMQTDQNGLVVATNIATFLTGTSNQIIITSGTKGSTFSAPQNLHTESNFNVSTLNLLAAVSETQGCLKQNDAVVFFTSGSNIFMGSGSGRFSDVTMANNIGIGISSLTNVAPDSIYNSNIAVGSYTLNQITSGGQNVAIGQGALRDTLENYNVAIGYIAGLRNTGSYNIYIGASCGAMHSGSESEKNVAIGNACLSFSDGNGESVHHASILGHKAGHTRQCTFSSLVGAYAASAVSASIRGSVAIGYQSMRSSLGGLYNTAIGYETSQFVGTPQNISIGKNALWSYPGLSGSANFGNIAIGSFTLKELTAGGKNIALGYNALRSSSLGDYNIALGYRSGFNHTISDNTITIGWNAGPNSANNCIAIGQNALSCSSPGVDNIAIGQNTLLGLSNNGTNNIAIGKYSIGTTVNSSQTNDNIAMGQYSLYSLDGGDRNIAIGSFALSGTTSGLYNCSIGYQSGKELTNNSYNAFYGYQTGMAVTGAGNIAIGALAMSNPIIPSAACNYNIAIGYSALDSLDGAGDNIAIGRASLDDLETGDDNIAIGRNALSELSSESDNVAIGSLAGQYVKGTLNVAVGYNAMSSVDPSIGAANYNVAIGASALSSIDTGDGNIAIGYNIASSLTSGSNNCLLGSGCGAALTTESGNLFLGYQAGATIAASNTLIIANSNTVTPLIYGEFDTPILKLISSGSADVTIAADNDAPNSDILQSGSICYYIDDVTNNLMVKVKYGDGTVKSGTVCAIA